MSGANQSCWGLVVKAPHGGADVLVDIRPQWLRDRALEAAALARLYRGAIDERGLLHYHAVTEADVCAFLSSVVDSWEVKWMHHKSGAEDFSESGRVQYICESDDMYGPGVITGVVRRGGEMWVPPPPAADWFDAEMMFCYGASVATGRPAVIMPCAHPGVAISVPVQSEPGVYAVMAGHCCGRCSGRAHVCAARHIGDALGESNTGVSTAGGRTWYVSHSNMVALKWFGGAPHVGRANGLWPPVTQWAPVCMADPNDGVTQQQEKTRKQIQWQQTMDQLRSDQALLDQLVVLHTLSASIM
jgi:hypothetical protein